LNTKEVEIINQLATASLQQGKAQEAVDLYKKAIAIDPDHAETYSNIGAGLRQLGMYREALDAYDRAISLNPKSEIAHSNRGVICNDLGMFGEAHQAYSEAIKLNADYIEPYFNRGNLAVLRRDLLQAVQDFDRVIALSPRHYQARWNQALTLLLAGNLEEGWQAFESRWDIPAFCSEEKFSQPLWLGKEPLLNKTIFLHSEQGMGDTLQFCRYASMAKMIGAKKVILGVERPLKLVMQTLEGVDEVISRGDPLPNFDYHCPMMSLPLAFNTTLATIPARESYLTVDPVKQAYWENKLGPRLKLRVGLVWSGGFRPNQPEVWEINRRRNIALESLTALKMDGVDFISLQKGDTAEAELKKLTFEQWSGPNIADHINEIKDFSDTAALISNLDLLISVDTSTAHLAAALGKPVWLLNRYDTCWRWLLERSDSPWYPTMKIYRQPKIGDWASVISQVRSDLLAVTEPLRL
jgi:Flp pilus assembly protein TadD